MANILDVDYREAEQRHHYTNFINAAEGPLGFMTTPQDDPDAWETASLIYQREAIIGSTMTHGVSRDDMTYGNYSYDRSFNPTHIGMTIVTVEPPRCLYASRYV